MLASPTSRISSPTMETQQQTLCQIAPNLATCPLPQQQSAEPITTSPSRPSRRPADPPVQQIPPTTATIKFTDFEFIFPDPEREYSVHTVGRHLARELGMVFNHYESFCKEKGFVVARNGLKDV
ncbi:hypothetical protein HDU76_007424, partial [Blyttiomyces sp. JEL0837]